MKIKRLLSLSTAFLLTMSTLLFLGVPLASAADQDCTWTGSTNFNFSTATNWTGCGGAAPGNADRLVFPRNVTNRGPFNDLSGITFQSITFTGSGGDYYISGTPFSLTNGIIDNSVANTASNASNNWIDIDITFSGDQSINVNDEYALTNLMGNIGGTGNITKTGIGAIMFSGDNSAWQGGVTANGGDVIAAASKALGDGGDIGAVVNTGAELLLFPCGFTTLEGNVTLNGDSFMPTGDFAVPKLGVFASCSGSGSASEVYGGSGEADSATTLTGTITLGSNITFASYSGTTTLSGALVGSHSITMLPGYTGKLVIESSANGSNTPNGTFSSAQVTKTISDSNSNTVDIYGNNVITINGVRGDTAIYNGGTLKGTGTVGALSVNSGGKIAPGQSPGCLASGNLTLNSGSTYEAEIAGTTACTQYDQMNVTGTVSLGNASLSAILLNGFTASQGNTFTIISNDGADPVTGTFNNLAEGATFTVGTTVFKISYVGGDGNDVVLSVQNVPTTPNTGIRLITSNPLATLLITTLSAGTLLYIAKRYKFIASRVR